MLCRDIGWTYASTSSCTYSLVQSGCFSRYKSCCYQNIDEIDTSCAGWRLCFSQLIGFLDYIWLYSCSYFIYCLFNFSVDYFINNVLFSFIRLLVTYLLLCITWSSFWMGRCPFALVPIYKLDWKLSSFVFGLITKGYVTKGYVKGEEPKITWFI